ncbi:hypothetical protein TNCV_4705971 [Trichonephila clavipes]|nr:hypothetical protein TNCV_4705971 [Trichonephila clavipes]
MDKPVCVIVRHAHLFASGYCFYEYSTTNAMYCLHLWGIGGAYICVDAQGLLLRKVPGPQETLRRPWLRARLLSVRTEWPHGAQLQYEERDLHLGSVPGGPQSQSSASAGC